MCSECLLGSCRVVVQVCPVVRAAHAPGLWGDKSDDNSKNPVDMQ